MEDEQLKKSGGKRALKEIQNLPQQSTSTTGAAKQDITIEKVEAAKKKSNKEQSSPSSVIFTELKRLVPRVMPSLSGLFFNNGCFLAPGSSKQPSQEQKDNDMGPYFSKLPDELLLGLLRQLDMSDLETLSLTNYCLAQFIVGHFLVASSGVQWLIRASQLGDLLLAREAELELARKLFESLGRLIKKCTYVHRTSQRIDLFFTVLDNTYGAVSVAYFDAYNSSQIKLIFKFYGGMLNALTAGWDSPECEKLYYRLKDKFNLDYLEGRFQNCPLGAKPKHEQLIRYFYRMITNSSNRTLFGERLRWLANMLEIGLLLDNHDYINYCALAKFFIVVFGPLVATINNSAQRGTVQNTTSAYIPWWDLTDGAFLNVGLEDLGLVLAVLFEQANEEPTLAVGWYKNFIVDLLDRIISVPGRWAALNVAVLLYHTGETLALRFLVKKLATAFDFATDILGLLLAVTVRRHKGREGRPLVKTSGRIHAVASLFEVLLSLYETELANGVCRFFAVQDRVLLMADEEDQRLEEDQLLEGAQGLTALDLADAKNELMRLLMLRNICLKK